MPPIGFVLMSHQSGGQLLRLVEALNQLYDDPPIGCHHDFSQAELDIEAFPSNVQFVTPSRKTAWGRIMTVDAALDALKLLYSADDPDWFVLLGISDYPIMPAERVLLQLRSAQVDALLDYRSVGEPDLHIPPAANPCVEHFDYPANRRIAERRYLDTQMWVPILRRAPNGGWRLGRATTYLPVHYPFGPFNRKFRCFNGSHWFAGTRHAAEILLNRSRQHVRVRQYYARRAVPEESYYQTILCNSDLYIERHNRRFERWEGGGAHPQWLTSEDLEQMLNSGCHFARKFRTDEPVLDQLDEALGIKSYRRSS